MSKIQAVKVLREKAGFGLKEGLEQVNILLELAKNGNLLPANVFLAGPKGAVELVEVYAALAGVKE